MAKKADVAFLGVFAAGLGLAGAWVLSKPALELQTRNPMLVLHLKGVAQLLFAAGPVLAGVTLAMAALRVARGGDLRPDTVSTREAVCFLLGIACLLAGLFLGDRRPVA
jgi:hypothetical protein